MQAAIPDHILTEAATWLMEMHDGPLPPERRAQLAQWRERSPEHQRAWEKASLLMDKFSGLPPGGAIALRKAPARRRAIKTVAALLVAGPAAWLAFRHAPWLQNDNTYRTAIGEHREIVLADGTRVHLNTDSEIDVFFSQTLRGIWLHRGEILVTTAKDPRSLMVSVDEGYIKALGTRFMVRRSGEQNKIAVFEGAVELSLSEAPYSLLHVPAGKQSAMSATRIDPLSDADDNSSAWASGMLIANQMPLSQFIAELSRYRRGVLECDPALARLPVSGVFPLNDTSLALSLLEQTMPVHMQYRTRYWVRVTRPEK
ncbi:FecR family protein [Duganella sp. sic0402]|uniref:FecR domain-containing protein n=1 Tax=Duganella sp. sic0402 TaxID=2854786 RepID=UPI001C47F949|nr:FecR family protein [Duganella sp. sic0402]MBV7536845.1 FecR family protein [Duganella sp. sic0402]